MAITKNISSRGICLTSYTALTKGDIISVEVKLPGNQVVNFKGEVMWIVPFDSGDKSTLHKYEAGVKIIDIKTEDLEVLTKFTFTYFFQSKELI